MEHFFCSHSLCFDSALPLNPLMGGANETPSKSLAAVPASSSGGGRVRAFADPDYASVASAHNEAVLMNTSIALFFRRSVMDEAPVCELLTMMTNPARAETLRALPQFRKKAMRVRTLLKLVHVASVVVKENIRAVGRFMFSAPAATQITMTLLWHAMVPIDMPFDGDMQMQNLHESLRLAHFCDVLELLRIYHRAALIDFLRHGVLPIGAGGARVGPLELMVRHFDHEGVVNLFVSLLGAELVPPRQVWFSDHPDLVPRLLDRLVVPPDAGVEGERAAENTSYVIKRIVSSPDHAMLNGALMAVHGRIHQLAFGSVSSSPKQFCFVLRVLGDWALVTLGGLREVADETRLQCVNTTLSHLGTVRDVLRQSPDATKIGFVRFELVGYVAALMNTRNAYARRESGLLA